MTSTQPPEVQDIAEARRRLGERIRCTPLWRWQLEEPASARTEFLLKLELFQVTGSFKARGALTVMSTLDAEQLGRGVTAVSAGNHALAVAYAARTYESTAKVVMPRSANPVRVEGCRRLGAEVLLVDDVQQAFAEVRRIETEERRFFVHPFEGPLVALGTATLGLELHQQDAALEAVVVPIGGGGLCAGVAAALKQLNPRIKVYGVEPEGADTMHRSFASGKPETLDKVRTIADSLGAPHAAPYSFALCREYVDRLVKVSDDEICRAMALLYTHAKLAVEPAGAASTAAALGPLRPEIAGKRTALIVCGANVDIDTFSECIRRGNALRAQGMTH